MKLHPAMKQANKVIRKAGFTFIPTGALSVKIYNGMFDGVHVDIELSRDADVGKLKVCQFSHNPELAELLNTKLNNVIFSF